MTLQQRRRLSREDKERGNISSATSTLTLSTTTTTRGGGAAIIKSNTKAVTPTTTTTASSTTTTSSTASSSAVATQSWTKRMRNILFPIYEEETTKFFLIGSIKFFVILALTLTRDNKDTMVVTECGAEAIAFLKIYGVLPSATLFIGVYSKMSNFLEKKTLFYTTCIPFFLFFFLFDAVIYPNRASIQPSLSTAQSILGTSSQSTSGASVIFAKLIANWTSALFYIVAEVYSSVSVGILFWQYANDVVSVSQAKRFYPLFAQMSGLAPIVAGQYVVRYASRAKDFGESLHRLTWMVTFSGVMICLFYRWSNAYIERMAEAESRADEGKNKAVQPERKAKKKKKAKMSMAESAKFLASSEYLRLIASLVVGYGLSINFTDIMWKSIVKQQYPDPLDYQRFISQFSSIVGLSTCIVIFVGVHAIRILGWRIGALTTPLVMACLAFPFFSGVIMGLDTPRRLKIAVTLGMVQTLLAKTTKYALFDPTTQMAYIPLDDESKVKGKAAIEVIGSRIGKSGGSLIQQGLVLVFGNIISAAPVLAVLYYSVLAWWAYSANRLSELFYARTAMQESKEHEE
eukprot:CAMPEP_0196161596 /NCGR_PEP_ID=MMETSP0910-20130528/47413_1 /TAXON_ID=49265 /ORGANISM="Thalassiosira rotula, Strain GSO102" /LENGTH=573 /DNA_ID=CAMNT_0041426541 /DNA_START=464 /DNA_END=2185 /DNA_ORIENTATION=+